jgi:hypothetical protein
MSRSLRTVRLALHHVRGINQRCEFFMFHRSACFPIENDIPFCDLIQLTADIYSITPNVRLRTEQRAHKEDYCDSKLNPGKCQGLASDLITRSFIMIQVKKTSTITLIISAAFLLASTSAIAEYSQTQNKVDDKQDSGKQSQPNTAPTKKSDEDKSGKSASDTKPDSNANKPAEADKKAPAGTERKGNY